MSIAFGYESSRYETSNSIYIFVEQSPIEVRASITISLPIRHHRRPSFLSGQFEERTSHATHSHTSSCQAALNITLRVDILYCSISATMG